MAQNITIAGADYPDVPSIVVPKTGGGQASYIDLSGDTVTAAAMLSGFTAHNAAGEPITGTAMLGVPTEISTSAGMAEVLISANVDKAYKFTGTTDDTYTNGDIYIVEAG